MKRDINRSYVVGVIVGMITSGVGAHVYNKGKLDNWWNMFLLLLSINIAIIIGSVIAQMIAEDSSEEEDE